MCAQKLTGSQLRLHLLPKLDTARPNLGYKRSMYNTDVIRVLVEITVRTLSFYVCCYVWNVEVTVYNYNVGFLAWHDTTAVLTVLFSIKVNVQINSWKIIQNVARLKS